jgi:hypothetical protein
MKSRLGNMVSIVVIFTCGCNGGARPLLQESPADVSTATLEILPLPSLTITLEASPTSIPSKTFKPRHTPTTTSTYTPTPFASGPFQPLIPDVPFPHEILSILAVQPDESLWLETEQEVLIFQDGVWEVYLPEVPGELVGIDSEGRIWVINPDESKISSWDGTGWSHYTESDGWVVRGQSVWSKNQLVTDQLGQEWFVINNELWVFDGKRFIKGSLADFGVIHPLEIDEGLMPTLTIVFLEKINELWLGSCYWTGSGPIGGGGVLRYDGVTWHPVDSLVSSGCTEAIVEDHAGDVWIGLDGSLWHLDPQVETWSEFESPSPPFDGNTFFNNIPEITFDPEDNPWAEFLVCGGAGCGHGPYLYRFQNGLWHGIVGEEFQYQRQMVYDNLGTAWLFTPGGIFEVIENSLELAAELKVNPHSIVEGSSGQVWFLVEDNEHPLWVHRAGTPSH